jgi:purine-nucleoside phosphorylase
MKNSKEAADFIRKGFDGKVDIAVIEGSGIDTFDDTYEKVFSASYRDIPHFPLSTVEGHAGQFSVYKKGNKAIADFKGRIHFYEGYSMWDVVFPIRLVYHLGIKNILLTNAAGSLTKAIEPGDLIILEDYINFAQNNPLIGYEPEFGERFVDMSDPFDKRMIKTAVTIYEKLNFPVKYGVYVFLTGPTYETSSEVKMIKLLGGNLVGMSTVPELIMARQMGINVLGISLCTNFGTGISDTPLSHSEVIETGKLAKRKLKDFFREFTDVL